MATFHSKTASGRSVGRIIVLVHTAEAPTDADWQLVLDFFRESGDLRNLGAIVHTEGAAPNAAQRAKLNTMLGGVKMPIAVLTPSSVARMAGTAIAWFNPELRIFAPGDVDKAFDHVKVAREDREAVRSTLLELKREMLA